MIIAIIVIIKIIKFIITISAFDCGGGDEGGGRSEAWGEDDTRGKGYCKSIL